MYRYILNSGLLKTSCRLVVPDAEAAFLYTDAYISDNVASDLPT
jgi:hypothetical protein